jgi:anti-sigma regulatory factor (Ser/Thr protein kinase)
VSAPEPCAVTVTEATEVGVARRQAAVLAGRLGFDETQAGRLALVVTEAATNLVKHAGGGQILLQPSANGPGALVDVLALDQGPGIPDLRRSLADGYSTAASPGTGLGAIRRLAARFDVYSAPGHGAAVLARIPARPAASRGAGPGVEVGGICVPLAGEACSGDAWTMREGPGVTHLLVADGLGHGPDAAAAAAEAVRAFEAGEALAPGAMVERLHAALRPTRGAAVAVAEIDRARRVLHFAGVGNIAGVLHGETGDGHHLVSYAGIAGHEVRRVKELAYPWPDAALLVLHSDGLGTHWSLAAYPALARRDPTLIAGVLYRDHARKRDDVSVVVAKEPRR